MGKVREIKTQFVNKSAIEALEYALELAREGTLVSVSIAATTHDNDIFVDMSNCYKMSLMYLALSKLRQQALDFCVGDDD